MRAHLRVEREQRALQVAARHLAVARRAQVAADGRLGAHLGIGDVRRARAERRAEVDERGDRRGRADRDRLAVPRDAREPGVSEEERACRRDATRGDRRHDDRPAADHGDVRPVAEQLDGLGRGTWHQNFAHS